MSRSSRHKEKYVNGTELSEASTIEGSAARTRPFSLEDIMIRRKNKSVTADAKDRAGEPDDLSRKEKVGSIPENPEHDGGYRHSKDSAYVDSKKATEDSKKRNSRKEKSTSLKDRSSVKGGDKENHDAETKLRAKLDDETDRVKEHKNHKQSHHKSRNEEHSRDVIDTGKAKDRKNENKSHHRSRAEEHPRDDNEMDRARERRDEKQSRHRSRNEKRPRDDIETRRKHADKLVEKETLDSEMERSERESKRKHGNRDERKDRLETDGSAVQKHDAGKHNAELDERKDKRKAKSLYEKPVEKGRRSRSREHRARERSISRSPKAHKRTYEGQELGESSLNTSKDRRQTSDVDKNRVSSNGGHMSSHNWRHGGRGSRLGGYSPRKRRSEAAIKTPSPTARSPERKNAAWDLPPTGTGSMPAGIISDYQPLHQSVVPTRPNAEGALSGSLPSSVSEAKDVSADPTQLAEATRPLRRLYVLNLPASASEKSVIECLNNFLLSATNHIQGIQPCISCNINKEKGHALVEFLTAEDAARALSFDGKPFSSSVLKIRRPKDFVDSATGDAESSVPAVATITDIVKDSPHKIFVAGISKALSSDMLMEIVSAFGHLKAYRFEVNDDLKEPCAFLEYIDQAVTLQACAGLNGMKVAGQVLTVVQAAPDAFIEEKNDKHPFYGIPEHAKPLLSKPTKVLKLKNVFNPEDFSSLSRSELEETMEDIRIECARFGTIKSINVVKYESNCAIAGQTDERKLEEGDSFTNVTKTLEQDIDHNSGETIIAEASVNVKESVEVAVDFKDGRGSDDKLEEDFGKIEVSKMCQLDSSLAADVPATDINSNTNTREAPLKLDTSEDKFMDTADFIKNEDTRMNDNVMVEKEIKQEEPNAGLQESSMQLNHTVRGESETSNKDDSKQEISVDEVFEQGCFFVEYLRIEASCAAAHCLHGRLYGDRMVMVSYIPHDQYLLRFPK